MRKLSAKQIRLMQTISSYRERSGQKWYDEALKSFGAYYLFKLIFNSDSTIIHAFSELSKKNYTTLKKDLKEQAIVAEQIIAKNEDRANPIDVFLNFKRVIFTTLTKDSSILYNKYEFMLNERPRPKHEEFIRE